MTRLLKAAQEGDAAAPEELLPLIYAELRRLANHLMQGERPGQTIQATGLVHEAFIKLVSNEDQSWESRRHFFNTAALAMRRILIDRARSKKRQKRGGEENFAEIDAVEIPLFEEHPREKIEEIDAALNKLERRDPRACELIQHRFFGGLNIQQTAELMGVSPATIKNDWAFAKAWLAREIEGTPHDEGASVT